LRRTRSPRKRSNFGQLCSEDRAKSGTSVGEVTAYDSVQKHSNPSCDHESSNSRVAHFGRRLHWLILTSKRSSEEVEYERFLDAGQFHRDSRAKRDRVIECLMTRSKIPLLHYVKIMPVLRNCEGRPGHISATTTSW